MCLSTALLPVFIAQDCIFDDRNVSADREVTGGDRGAAAQTHLLHSAHHI